MVTAIGRWCFDHRGRTVLGWFVALGVIFLAAGALGPAFGATSEVPNSDSADGIAVLDEYFPRLGAGGTSGTIVFRADQGVDDPEVTAAMEALFARVDAGFPDDSGVPEHPGGTVISPYSEQGGGQIAVDGDLAGKIAFASVNLAADVDDTESGLIGKAIMRDAPEIEGLEVLAGGQYLAVVEPPQTELIGVAFAIVVLILAFGSVLAMGLPIAVAVGGVGAGIGLATVAGHVLDVPDFSTMLGMMIGLGVGIDYALFIVTRYREGLHRGLASRQALTGAMNSAGRAVIFAGFTVVISMLGLLLIGIGWVGGMGIAISLTVLTTMISSVTLLPALLGWAGERVEITRWRGLIAAGFAAIALGGLGIGFMPLAAAGAVGVLATFALSFAAKDLRRLVPPRRAKPARETWAYRWSRTIQRHPLVAATAATLVLLALAAPVLDMRLGWTDESNFAEETYTRQAYELMAEGFGDGFNGPLVVTVVPDATTSIASAAQSVSTLEQALAAADGVAAVAPAMANDPANPEAWLLTVIPTTSPQDEATNQLVIDLRDEVIPAAVDAAGLDVNVTGLVATNIDITDYLGQRTPLFFGGVLTLSFLLLLMVFRSILVPVKAVIMNMLSIAAAYGAVVAVFQWGWGGSILGIEGGPVNPFIPMMLFAIVFGLSMDYEVFMLSRIREEYDRTGDAVTSVADGLANTARVISAAAAIMVVVFGSFMFEDFREVKLMGMGLALAVLLDATLVRMLLVPATMELLGARNWWIPAWLDRLLPELHVEGRRPRSETGLPPEPVSEPGDAGQYPLPRPATDPLGEKVPL